MVTEIAEIPKNGGKKSLIICHLLKYLMIGFIEVRN